jgi:hypothetical protein
MDPICRSPYRLAALRKCRTKGLTEDRTQSRPQTVQKTLASWTETTEVLRLVTVNEQDLGNPHFARTAVKHLRRS